MNLGTPAQIIFYFKLFLGLILLIESLHSQGLSFDETKKIIGIISLDAKQQVLSGVAQIGLP